MKSFANGFRWAVFPAAAWLLSGLIGCSDNVETGTTSSSSSGGTYVPKPIEWTAISDSGAPSPRHLHSAVWTGSKMIIWGGYTNGMPTATSAGAIYDPETQSWKATSEMGAPTARHSHTAVWTGSKMIVWGGYSNNGLAQGGGAYDPESDSWTALQTSGEPSARVDHSAVWTGKSMIIWGGRSDTQPTNSGAIYSPENDTWTAINTQGGPSPRYAATSAWTGSQWMLWGGYDFFDWQNDGAVFDPQKNAWIQSIPSAGAPTPRQSAVGAWDGSHFIVWGGWTGGPYENTGGMWNPKTTSNNNGWTSITMQNAPAARSFHSGVWTGHELIVWGGCGGDACTTFYGDGGRFAPSETGGTWTPIAEQPALPPRRNHSAVVSNTLILIWGGRLGLSEPLNSGASSLF